MERSEPTFHLTKMMPHVDAQKIKKMPRIEAIIRNYKVLGVITFFWRNPPL